MDELVARIRPILSKHFKPALLARMTIVPYFPIAPDALKGIARLKLGKLAARCKEAHNLELAIDDAVIDAIAARCTEVETGARNVDHIINGQLTPKLATEILTHLGSGTMPARITVSLAADGGFALSAE